MLRPQQLVLLLSLFLWTACQPGSSQSSAPQNITTPTPNTPNHPMTLAESTLRTHIKKTNINVSIVSTKTTGWTFFEVTFVGERVQPVFYVLKKDQSVILPKEAEAELKKILLTRQSHTLNADELAHLTMMLLRPTNAAVLTEARRTNLRRRVRDPRLTLPTLNRTDKKEMTLSFWTVPTGRTTGYRLFTVMLDQSGGLKVTQELAHFKSKIYE